MLQEGEAVTEPGEGGKLGGWGAPWKCRQGVELEE